MNKFAASALVLALILTPSSALAAKVKPSVSIVVPTKNASYNRTAQMPITFALGDVTRPMVVVTTIKLEKEDTKHPSVGDISGTGYQHTVYAGQTTAGFTHDWGLNSTIPGKYSITSELHECNAKGCDYAPAGKLLSKKGKPVMVIVRNDAGTTISPTTNTGTSVELLSPNGDEEYVAGSGRLTIKWNAEGVPKGATVCTLLEKRGSTGGTFVFPGNKACKKAKEGKDSVSGKLLWTSGYNLSPGDYWARVSINAKASGGKDGGTLAQDISDDYFTLESR